MWGVVEVRRRPAAASVLERRRALLPLAAAVGTVATGFITHGRAESAAGDSVLAGRINESAERTWLRSSSGDSTLRLVNTATGAALDAQVRSGIAGVFYSRDLGISVIAKRGIFIHSGAQAIEAVSDASVGLSAQSRSSSPAIVADSTGLGTAVLASSYDGMGSYGKALDARGRVSFKSADTAVVPAGATGVDVDLGGELADGDAIVLVTIQEESNLSVRYAKVTDQRSIHIELTGRAVRDLQVGYFVLN